MSIHFGELGPRGWSAMNVRGS